VRDGTLSFTVSAFVALGNYLFGPDAQERFCRGLFTQRREGVSAQSPQAGARRRVCEMLAASSENRKRYWIIPFASGLRPG